MNAFPNSPSSSDSSAFARWRMARRILVAAAAVATVVAVFYTVENWRGQRAWDNSRRALEAKGEVLDWSAYIPTPVPDGQNFYKAPKMKGWFVRDNFAIGGPEPTNVSRPIVPAPRKDMDLVLAEVEVIASNAPLDSQAADAVVRFDDHAAREQVAALVRTALGPCAIGARGCVLLARPLDQLKPLHLVLRTDIVPTPKELAAFFPSHPQINPAHASSNSSDFRVEPAGSTAFRLSLKAPVYGAADYLGWTEPQSADFDLLRKALERPYARIDCDYQQPFAIGLPNFILIRNMSQTLAQRAQCYLLLGRPDAAWHELALINGLCHILQAKPSGKPLTLVGAMIDVAVTGLYAGIVQDGLLLHAWREPELLAMERQLKDTDLLAQVVEALREERAATCRTFEITRRGALLKLFAFKGSLSKSGFALMPRGWFYQNMALGAQLEQEMLGSVDFTNRLVLPRHVSEVVRRLPAESRQRSPYSFLVAVALPNFAKALQTASGNQTLVDQARLACALERYRLSQGQYPETLDALTPRIIETLPHDLIGGQPFKYRRTDSGGYLLYSVGWNERDEGGVPGNTREEGDWVWQLH